MHTLTMPLADAILASKALLNHVGNDDITPIITQAAVIEYEEQKYLVATDRYSFGRFMLGDLDTFDGEPGVMIPKAALTWVSKIVPKALRRNYFPNATPAEGGYALRFTWTPVEGSPNSAQFEVEVAIVILGKTERTQTFDVYSGNYPPVAKLWRGADVEVTPTTSVRLAPMSLSKIAADIVLFEGKSSGATLELHAPAGKPGPVQYALGKRWTAAVQPMAFAR